MHERIERNGNEVKQLGKERKRDKIVIGTEKKIVNAEWRIWKSSERAQIELKRENAMLKRGNFDADDTHTHTLIQCKKQGKNFDNLARI